MIWVGIDVGRNTGLAVWDSGARGFRFIGCMAIHHAMRSVLRLADEVGRDNLRVIFEDARQRQWLPRERTVSEYRGKLMGAGSVKRDSTIWADFLKDYEIPFRALPPQKGLTKWTEEAFKKVTGYQGRTNEHGRDAAMLVFERGQVLTK